MQINFLYDIFSNKRQIYNYEEISKENDYSNQEFYIMLSENFFAISFKTLKKTCKIAGCIGLILILYNPINKLSQTIKKLSKLHKNIHFEFCYDLGLEEIVKNTKTFPRKVNFVLNLRSLNNFLISPLLFYNVFRDKIKLIIISDILNQVPTLLFYGSNDLEKILLDVLIKKNSVTILIDNNLDILFESKKEKNLFTKKAQKIQHKTRTKGFLKEKIIKKDIINVRLLYLFEILNQANIQLGTNYTKDLKSLYQYEMDSLKKIIG